MKRIFVIVCSTPNLFGLQDLQQEIDKAQCELEDVINQLRY